MPILVLCLFGRVCFIEFDKDIKTRFGCDMKLKIVRTKLDYWQITEEDYTIIIWWHYDSEQLMTFLGWLQCWEWFLHLLWHRAIISLTPHRVQLGFNRCWIKPYGTGIWVDAVARAVSTRRHDHPLWRRKRWMSFVRRLSRWSLKCTQRTVMENSCISSLWIVPWTLTPLALLLRPVMGHSATAPARLQNGWRPAGSTCGGNSGEQHSITGPRDTDVIWDTGDVFAWGMGWEG